MIQFLLEGKCLPKKLKSRVCALSPIQPNEILWLWIQVRWIVVRHLSKLLVGGIWCTAFGMQEMLLYSAGKLTLTQVSYFQRLIKILFLGLCTFETMKLLQKNLKLWASHSLCLMQVVKIFSWVPSTPILHWITERNMWGWQ